MRRYIIDNRLLFPKGMQRQFLEHIKKTSGLRWGELARQVNVSEHMLRADWKLEKATLPKSVAERLAQFSHQQEIKKYLRLVGTSNGKNMEAIGAIFAPVI